MIMIVDILFHISPFLRFIQQQYMYIDLLSKALTVEKMQK